MLTHPSNLSTCYSKPSECDCTSFAVVECARTKCFRAGEFAVAREDGTTNWAIIFGLNADIMRTDAQAC